MIWTKVKMQSFAHKCIYSTCKPIHCYLNKKKLKLRIYEARKNVSNRFYHVCTLVKQE